MKSASRKYASQAASLLAGFVEAAASIRSSSICCSRLRIKRATSGTSARLAA